MKALVYLLLFPLLPSGAGNNSTREEAIVGNWMSNENNLEVTIYKVNNEFRAKIIWFDDSDNPAEPVNQRLDSKNPDKSLRNRKVVGMEVLYGLTYNAEDEEWENGHIYDCSSGKEWNAKMWLAKDGTLKVRGYWHFEILGENMSFKKV